ncbi:MAG TPA: hypothetical protein VII50_11855, partial [Acidothermaceae bacterium]
MTYFVHAPSPHKSGQHLTLARRQRLERCELTMASRSLAPAFVQQVEAALSRHEWLAYGCEPHMVDEAIKILDLLDQTDRSRLQALAKTRPVGRTCHHDNPHARSRERGDHLRAIARFAKIEIKQHDVGVLMQAFIYYTVGAAPFAKVDRMDFSSLCGE